MKASFYDTLTQQFIKLDSNDFSSVPLNVYVCGPTVYNFIHIGNARTLVFFDVVVRHLRAIGFKVNYIRNITDVDDKIIQKAQDEGVSAQELAQKYTEAFNKDMSQLGEVSPDVSPKATEHIPEMVQAIQQLLDDGYAYLLDDGVYYDVSKFEQYGKLSKKKQEDLIAGARVDLDSKKRNAGDFALWKLAKPGEPSWDAAFGKGRPGWHIECSIMARKYANGQLDLHGGGIDLIHPHHENEIAQSEALDRENPFSRYWVHVAFLNIGKEKMSKSKGNFILLNNLLKWFHPEVLRLFLLSGHYRGPLDFSVPFLIEKHHSLWRFYAQKAIVLKSINVKDLPKIAADQNPVLRAFAEDLNSPKAIGHIFEIMKKAYRDVLNNKITEDTLKSISCVHAASPVLGVFGDDPEHFVQTVEALMLKHISISKEEIEEKLQRRLDARKKKDYGASDAIRSELSGHGIQIQDLENDQVSWIISPQLD